MTLDFGNIEKLKVSGDAVQRYDFDNIQMPGAHVMVAPATRANRQFTTGQLTLALSYQRGGGKVRLSAEKVNQLRDQMRPLYASHILRGWGGIVDASGVEAPFTPENALSFLKALPDQEFDDLIEFCTDENNFRRMPFDVEEAAKN